MGKKRSFRASAKAARQLIRRNDVFHDPVAIERGGDGLEYVPEKIAPGEGPIQEDDTNTNPLISDFEDIQEGE